LTYAVMIVDDEQLCLDDTVYMLSRHDDVEIVGALQSRWKLWKPHRAPP
jgi:DNA-binding NarL/FixJ family response regulator